MTRKREEADICVASVGCLEVLSVGKGDLKLTWDRDNPDDVDKARKTIEEMLRKGYSIFVETDDGPSRVTDFNPKRMTYIITEIADGTELPAAPVRPALPAGAPVKPDEIMSPKKRGRPKGSTNKRTRQREVPVAGSRATAVGKTSGG
jgi:hypothetical protein